MTEYGGLRPSSLRHGDTLARLHVWRCLPGNSTLWIILIFIHIGSVASVYVTGLKHNRLKVNPD